MRTNVEIDDDLLAEAQAIAGAPTKKATIDFALRELIRHRERQRILELEGKMHWDGDLDAQRSTRAP